MNKNTLKYDQKHHFYATILARRRQIGPRRRQTLKSEELQSPDPGVSTGLVLVHRLYQHLKPPPKPTVVPRRRPDVGESGWTPLIRGHQIGEE